MPAPSPPRTPAASGPPEALTVSFQPVIGQAITIRPLRPDDTALERDFVAGLSQATRHSRLLGGAIKLTDEYVRRLTHLDWSREAALAAVVMLEDRETAIGVARYALDETGTACEFAIVVADAWQGRGIGRRLLDRLIVLARARGIKEIYGDTLATNQPMLQLLTRLGFELHRHPEDATLARGALRLC